MQNILLPEFKFQLLIKSKTNNWKP